MFVQHRTPLHSSSIPLYVLLLRGVHVNWLIPRYLTICFSSASQERLQTASERSPILASTHDHESPGTLVSRKDVPYAA